MESVISNTLDSIGSTRISKALFDLITKLLKNDPYAFAPGISVGRGSKSSKTLKRDFSFFMPNVNPDNSKY